MRQYGAKRHEIVGVDRADRPGFARAGQPALRPCPRGPTRAAWRGYISALILVSTTANADAFDKSPSDVWFVSLAKEVRSRFEEHAAPECLRIARNPNNLGWVDVMLYRNAPGIGVRFKSSKGISREVSRCILSDLSSHVFAGRPYVSIMRSIPKTARLALNEHFSVGVPPGVIVSPSTVEFLERALRTGSSKVRSELTHLLPYPASLGRDNCIQVVNGPGVQATLERDVRRAGSTQQTDLMGPIRGAGAGAGVHLMNLKVVVHEGFALVARDDAGTEELGDRSFFVCGILVPHQSDAGSTR